MKIVLIGFGSIGKRHLANLLALGYTDVSIVSRSGKVADEFTHLDIYSTLQQALAARHFDAAIVCTPTAQHIETVLPLLQNKVASIYLEKPISHTYETINEIVHWVQQNNTHFIVGYDLHFDPGLQKVKTLLTENAIGKPVSVNAQVGQYLPDWRPHEDYRKGMSAKKETGGGVLLDLVHEFDYLQWLVGDATAIASFNHNSASLEIETEDVAEVLLKFTNGVIGTIHLDYLQPTLVRNCLFTGSKGSIKWDLAKAQVVFTNHSKQEEVFDYQSFERNERFRQIMKAFLDKANDDRLTSLENGLKSLKMVLAAKYSAEHNVFVQLSQFNP